MLAVYERLAGGTHHLTGPHLAGDVEPALLFHGEFRATFAPNDGAELGLIGDGNVAQDGLALAPRALANQVEVGKCFLGAAELIEGFGGNQENVGVAEDPACRGRCRCRRRG